MPVYERPGSGYYRIGGMGAEEIQMEEDFVGNPATLPVCPYTDASGWCRSSITNTPIKQPVKLAAASKPLVISTATVKAMTAPMPAAPSSGGRSMSTTTKVAIAGAGLLALYLVTR